MDDSRVKIGYLVPLNSNLVEDDSIPKLPISQGVNLVGRNEISISDKRVSRMHMSLNASLEGSALTTVVGTNPIVIRSGNQRKKLCSLEKVRILNGDVIELIPGHHFFKYVTLNGGERKSSAGETHDSAVVKEKMLVENEELTLKRKRQINEDEALARTLQDEITNNSPARKGYLPSKNSGQYRSQVESPPPFENLEAIRQFSVPQNRLPSTFQLLRVKDLPAWANTSSVSIRDVIKGNVLVAILSNYMVDMDWLLSVCPSLSKVPCVLIIHGEGDGALHRLEKNKPANWTFYKPPLPISYGTHHSKAMLLVYPRGVRVVVHTSNLIYVDWNNKSQGLWMQDFPWKDQSNRNKGCGFENDLIDYLSALKLPEFSVNLPVLGNTRINSSFFKKFDYSSAAVRLIASVPGYHNGPNLKRWGHMKLRTILQEYVFGKEFQNSPLVYQFSSLGSLDEKWMDELASSMSSGLADNKTPLGLGKACIVWPTVEDVRCSIEGYGAGGCIPGPHKNVEKAFLKKYWSKWKANHTGRSHAMPHIKTFARYNGQNIAWFLLTSANLSKAAWGALQKNNSQLMIRSYELGVLFLPTFVKDGGFSCTDDGQGKSASSSNGEGCRTKLVTLCWQGNKDTDSSTEVIPIPVPYELPPQPYSSGDEPWSWDKQYTKKDVYGQVWPR